MPRFWTKKFSGFGLCATVIVTLLWSLPALTIEYWTVTDTTCTVPGAQPCPGPNSDGCTSTTFFVEGPGNYWLTASIDNCSTSTSCGGCFTRAYLYKQQNPPELVRCIHTGCCSADSVQVALSGSTYYTLYSCKVSCSQNDCNDCETSCVARATVHQ